MSLSAVHLVIHGRVQGVGYRAWTRSRAQAHGLTGWVRNRTEGTVEILLCGNTGDVILMQEECKEGPPSARVLEIVKTEWQGSIPADFKQLPTV